MSIPRPKIPQKLRNQIIARSDHLCQFCGSHETSIFEIHHIDEDKTNNSLDNLIAVCPDCHSKITKGIYSMSDVSLLAMKIKYGDLKYRHQNKNINVEINHGIVANNVTIKNNRKSPSKIVIPNSIASSVNHYNYIEYLVKRLSEWRSKDMRFIGANIYSTTRNILRNQFGAHLKDLPLDSFDYICQEIKNKIDRTRFGRTNNSKGHKNYSSYDEHIAKSKK